MRRLIPVLIVVLAASSLGGCATMYKSMGLATKADLAAQDEALKAATAQLESYAKRLEAAEAQAAAMKDVQSKVDEVQAAVGALGSSIEDFAKVSQAVEELRAKAATLPDETLKRLVDLLSQALAAAKP